MAKIFQETCESGDFSVFSGGSDTRASFSVWHADELAEKNQIPLGDVGAYDPVLSAKQANGGVAYKEHTLAAAIGNGETVWFQLPLNYFFDDKDDDEDWESGDAISFIDFRSAGGSEFRVQLSKADEVGYYRVGVLAEAAADTDVFNSLNSGIIAEDAEEFLELKLTVDTSAATSSAQVHLGRKPVGKTVVHGDAMNASGITIIRWGSCVATDVKVGYIQFGDFTHTSSQLFPPYEREDKIMTKRIEASQHLVVGPGVFVEARRWRESASGSKVEFYDTAENEQWESRHLDIIDEDLKITTRPLRFQEGLLAVVTGAAVATVSWVDAGLGDPADLVDLDDLNPDVVY